MEENAPRKKSKRQSKWTFQGGKKSEHKQVCVPLADSFLFYLSLFCIFSIYSYYV